METEQVEFYQHATIPTGATNYREIVESYRAFFEEMESKFPGLKILKCGERHVSPRDYI